MTKITSVRMIGDGVVAITLTDGNQPRGTVRFVTLDPDGTLRLTDVRIEA